MPGLAQACDIRGCPVCGSEVNATVITTHRCLDKVCGWSQSGNFHDAIYNTLLARHEQAVTLLRELYAIEEGPGETDRPQWQKVRAFLSSLDGGKR